MSEPTLYQEAAIVGVDGDREAIYENGTDWMPVVPVERCVHTDDRHPNGYIDGHYTVNEWCPGAGIRDNDDRRGR